MLTPAQLAERNVGMVYAIAAAEHKRIGGEYDDLVGDGMVGLMQAAQRFDPDRGVGFSTYAKVRVVGAMIEGFRRRHYYGHHGQGGFRREVVLDDTKHLHPTWVALSAEDEAMGWIALDILRARIAALPPHLRDAVNAKAAGPRAGALKALAAREGVTGCRISQRLGEAKRRLAA